MPSPRAFSDLGLFVHADFLDPARRVALAVRAAAAPHTPAAIEAGPGTAVDPDVRRTDEVTALDDTLAPLDRRLDALGPALGRHFGVTLGSAEPLGMLRYGPGSFYRAHRDRSSGTPGTRERAVSVVLFVNGRDGDGSYEGGALRFYGLLGEGPLAGVGLDMDPAAGTLVAFRSEVLHEVTPVTSGVRYTLVTWFSARDAAAGGGSPLP
ncbi:MAG: 2OG-Fe(II) oxygenase [Vicinamibacterales bacterium]|nr:2OG-Fe(II) oxygenase [Vicinamibacterales bacterium]